MTLIWRGNAFITRKRIQLQYSENPCRNKFELKMLGIVTMIASLKLSGPHPDTLRMLEERVTVETSAVNTALDSYKTWGIFIL